MSLNQTVSQGCEQLPSPQFENVKFNLSDERSILGSHLEMKCGDSEGEGVFISKLGEEILTAVNDQEVENFLWEKLQETKGTKKML